MSKYGWHEYTTITYTAAKGETLASALTPLILSPGELVVDGRTMIRRPRRASAVPEPLGHRRAITLGGVK